MSDVAKYLNALTQGAGLGPAGSTGAEALRCPTCGSPLNEQHQTGPGDRAAVLADLGVRDVKLRCPACGTVSDVTLPRGFTWNASIDIPNWGTIPAHTSALDSPAAPSADWYPDPLGRHQYRYWEGTSWTQHVADDGSTSLDPLETPARGATQSADAGRVARDASEPDDEGAAAGGSGDESGTGPDLAGARTVEVEPTPDIEHVAPVSIVAADEPPKTSPPDPQRVEELRVALRDVNWQECERAARSLKSIGWEPDTNEDRAWYLAAAGWPKPREQWVAVADAAIEPLTFALQERFYGSPWAQSGTQDDWNAGDRRTWAARALGEIGDIRALPALIDALNHNDQNGQTAAAAAEALGRIGDERAIEPLVSLLDSELDGGYSAPARAAATALGTIGGAPGIAALIAYVDTDFRKPDARVAAAHAMVALEVAGRLDGAQAQALSDLRARDDWPL